MSEIEDIQRNWSRDPAKFYKELEAFLEQHKNAHAIEYDNETKCPKAAIYAFVPFQSYIEKEILLTRLALQELDEDPKP